MILQPRGAGDISFLTLVKSPIRSLEPSSPSSSVSIFVWQKDLDLCRRAAPWKRQGGVSGGELRFFPLRNPFGSATTLTEPGLTPLGDSGFCSWVVTCDPARLRRLFTLTGVVSSAGQSGRFAEGRDTGLGMDGERKRLRGRQRITGCGGTTQRSL